MKINSRFLVALSILVVTVSLSEPLTTPANAGTQEQEDTKKQEYPIAFQPGPAPPAVFDESLENIKKVAVESSIEFIDLDLKPLLSEKVNRVQFWVGSDLGFIVAEKKRLEKSTLDGVCYYHWAGDILNIRGFATVGLTFRKTGNVLGHFHIGIRVFTVKTKTKGDSKITLIYEIDRAKDPGVIDRHEWPLLKRAAPARIKKHKSQVIPASPEEQSEIDLLMLYSPGLKQELIANDENINDLIGNMKDYTNNAFNNSGVNIKINITTNKELSFNEKASNEFMILLNDLANGRNKFCAVPALRDGYGADLVVCLQRFMDDPNESPWTYGMIHPPIPTDSCPNTAFIIIQVPMDREEALGIALSHEIGHLLSLHHSHYEWLADGGYSRFRDYGWGYYFVPDSYEYGTLMTAGRMRDEGQDFMRIPYFSNHTISKYFTGVPGGPYTIGKMEENPPNDPFYDNADARLAMNEFKDFAAAYRARPSLPFDVIESDDEGKNNAVLTLAPSDIADGSGLNILVCQPLVDPNIHYPLSNAAHVSYNPSTNEVTLVQDSGEPSPYASCLAGTQHVLRNSQVSINAAEVYGDNGSLTVPMSFTEDFIEEKDLWYRYEDQQGQDDWMEMGSLDIEHIRKIPTIQTLGFKDIVNGNDISQGNEVDVKVTLSDVNGNSDIKELYILITEHDYWAFEDDRGVCIRYEPRTVYDVNDRKIFWWNHNYEDGGNYWTTYGLEIGGYDSVENSEVRIEIPHTTAEMHATYFLDFSVRLKLKPHFSHYSPVRRILVPNLFVASSPSPSTCLQARLRRSERPRRELRNNNLAGNKLYHTSSDEIRSNLNSNQYLLLRTEKIV